MKSFIIFGLTFINTLVFAQDINLMNETEVDSLYREDQFYASLNYNLMHNRPSDYNQYSFSTGLSVGFIRDFPISNNRHWSLGVGLGYSYNNIKHNLLIQEGSLTNLYSTESDFKKNKLVLHYLDFPFEIRWRNSTPESHKFWRIYSGFKVSYLFSNKAYFNSKTLSTTVKKNSDIVKLQYGPYMSFGYNTINFYAYYALSPLFNNAKMNTNEELNLSNFNIGFMFYIL